MNFTQNIDDLESKAGISKDKLIQAHGAVGSASCIKCKQPGDYDKFKEAIKT